MIQHIVLISLSVFAIHYCLQSGEIFGSFGDWLRKILPEKLHNPVTDCPVCQAPWYGALIYWLFFPGPIEDFVLTIICSLGLNAIILKMTPDKETNYHEDIANVVESVDDLTEAYEARNNPVLERNTTQIFRTAESLKKMGSAIKRQNAKKRE